jgi:hypothetical protein
MRRHVRAMRRSRRAVFCAGLTGRGWASAESGDDEDVLDIPDVPFSPWRDDGLAV